MIKAKGQNGSVQDQMQLELLEDIKGSWENSCSQFKYTVHILQESQQITRHRNLEMIKSIPDTQRVFFAFNCNYTWCKRICQKWKSRDASKTTSPNNLVYKQHFWKYKLQNHCKKGHNRYALIKHQKDFIIIYLYSTYNHFFCKYSLYTGDNIQKMSFP